MQLIVPSEGRLPDIAPTCDLVRVPTQSQPVTIVMYHYVRPLQLTRYPAIKGLDLTLFREQLAYLKQHYSPIRMEDLLAASEGAGLPQNAVLLTFDDGYLDHYQYVFPALADAGLTGAFFAPAGVVLDRKLLDVNKIHFILAATSDIEPLVEQLERELRARGIVEIEGYRKQYWEASRYDSAAVIYFKRMLQHALPKELRAEITDSLFRKHVSSDERAFAEELYVGVDQLRLMARSGMHIGTHGDNHDWLGLMEPAAQEAEIVGSLRLLDRVGVPRDGFTFCYPYGSYNAATLEILKALGCRAAVTTKVDIAAVGGGSILELSRLDTNDLPKDSAASANTWTTRGQELSAKARGGYASANH